MSRIGVFFAEGYEEIEALTVVDVARRAGIEVSMISVEEKEEVKGSHGISVRMDGKLSETDFAGLDMLVLPGGKKGTEGLENCEKLMEQLDAEEHPDHFDPFVPVTFSDSIRAWKKAQELKKSVH